jgi:sulfite reductase alpha subunit
MVYDGRELYINDEDCSRCMHCITRIQALRPAGEKGANILIGRQSSFCNRSYAFMGAFALYKLEPPYDEFKALLKKIWGIEDMEKQREAGRACIKTRNERVS